MQSRIRHFSWLRVFAALLLITSSGCATATSSSSPLAFLSQQEPVPQQLTSASQSIGDASDYAMVSYPRRPASAPPQSSATCRAGFG
jgi:hypothetical protein